MLVALAFLLGLIFGGTFGCIVTALCVAAGRDEREE